MGSTLPTLRLFSKGPPVEILQSALNLWPHSKKVALNVDGVFGQKTYGKVREFQGANKLSMDGVVGPLTWAMLQAFVDQILGLSVPNSHDDTGEKIVTEAERSLSLWGWPGGQVTPNKLLPYIAAAICAESDNPFRPRQGGGPLHLIFQGAGAPPSYLPRCLTITKEAVKKWQDTSATATAWRNSADLPAWCGIFCYYVYFCAGINLGGWVNHGANVNTLKKFKIITDSTKVAPGYIGVVDGKGGGRNHHFIVKDNANGSIQSIDGNAWGPESPSDYSKGYRSVIKRGNYSYSYLKAHDAYFLFPDFAKL